MNFVDRAQMIMNKFSENKYLKSVTGAMVALLPFSIIGSIGSILATLPFQAWQNFLSNSGLNSSLNALVDYTINSLSLFLAFTMGRSLAIQLKRSEDSVQIGLISLLSFLIVTPYSVVGEGFDAQPMLPFEYLGAQGIFSALIIAFFVCHLYIFLKNKNIMIKLPDSVPPMIGKSFESIAPSTIIGLCMLVIQYLFRFTPFETIHALVYSVIQVPLQGLGGNPVSLIIAALIMPLLWFIGLHGTVILVAVLRPVLMPLDIENLAAWTQGAELPNTVGFNFFMLFTSGQMVYGLVLLMCFAKSKRYRTLGRTSLIPAFFGITEPIVFGTPLVLNFKFLIPYALSTVISVTTAYLAIILGIMPPLNGVSVTLGIPPVVRAVMQGSWRILAVLLFIFVITGLVWYPFFRAADKEALEEEQKLNEESKNQLAEEG